MIYLLYFSLATVPILGVIYSPLTLHDNTSKKYIATPVARSSGSQRPQASLSSPFDSPPKKIPCRTLYWQDMYCCQITHSKCDPELPHDAKTSLNSQGRIGLQSNNQVIDNQEKRNQKLQRDAELPQCAESLLESEGEKGPGSCQINKQVINEQRTLGLKGMPSVKPLVGPEGEKKLNDELPLEPFMLTIPPEPAQCAPQLDSSETILEHMTTYAPHKELTLGQFVYLLQYLRTDPRAERLNEQHEYTDRNLSLHY